MKIAVYCQHVLGVGHLHRAIELCRAFSDHEVILITGGPPVDAELPAHVDPVPLPPLKMDSNFGGLSAVEPGADLEAVKRRRRDQLIGLFSDPVPDCLILELYPFGRKAFRFELEPLIEMITTSGRKRCGVFSSVRDILVEKDNAAKHEARVVHALNQYFDGVFIHADPGLVKLEETFDRMAEITIPLVYTGYIAARPPQGARERLRSRLGLADDDALIIASAGGGQVGLELLRAAAGAAGIASRQMPLKLVAFTGPFMASADRRLLEEVAGGAVTIETFSPEFLSYLAAADLSISMAGYNTTMNILATRVPALVFPFAQNREQRLRAERLAAKQALGVLSEGDLKPKRLAAAIVATLSGPGPLTTTVDLDGAANTVNWIEQWGLETQR